MTDQDKPKTFPRMFEGIETFVSKFTTNRLHIKKEGQNVKLKAPDSGKKTNLTSLIGYLVGHYVRFTDADNEARKALEDNPDDFSIYQEAHEKRFKTAMYLSQMIAYAYALNLIEEPLNVKEIDELRKKNAELTHDVVDLRSKLENCEKNYEGLKKLHGMNKRQLGDVSP
jgi:FtsZ-binding cell division protein ZapB